MWAQPKMFNLLILYGSVKSQASSVGSKTKHASASKNLQSHRIKRFS